MVNARTIFRAYLLPTTSQFLQLHQTAHSLPLFIKFLRLDLLPLTSTFIVLSLAARRTPQFFVILRGAGIYAAMQALIKDFKDLSSQHPLAEFFKDPHHMFVSDKTVLSGPDCPKFRAAPKFVFEDFSEFNCHVGLSSLFEHRFRSMAKQYEGTMVYLPIPGSWSKQFQCHMSYTAILKLDTKTRKRQREAKIARRRYSQCGSFIFRASGEG